ncbi:LiaF transmembrane domain-containing protein [Petrocella sp. FN5]|uniref:LiaF transmembrane domain-containing protein n=1 Tax=Petrocella sp. FN5 TaxID=3032002 RepID=UPI0023DC6515|nr:DUF5668 domain-containing protein [Petrocella sp. FN5]MDF1616466.1 LiaF-related protein [Petrocella sp. FN5]
MNKRTVIGILILSVGLLALAGSLGYVKIDGLVRTFWPILLIAIGLINLVEQPKNFVFSGIMAIVGTIFLLRNLGFEYFEHLRFWDLIWPLVIILLGLWILTSKGPRGMFGRNQVSEDMVENVVLFSGAETINLSQNFKGGNIFAMFGGVDLDLRGAKIIEVPAKMDIFVAFGGVDIKVPEEWKVMVTGIPLFGGWGNKTRLSKDPNREIDLVINGFALFGGFDIKN